MTHPAAAVARGNRPRRAAFAAVLSLMIAAAFAQSSAGDYGAGGAARAGGARQLSSLPLGAQARISAALGSAAASYRVSFPHAGAAEASNRAQRLSARFARSGVELRSGGLQVGLSLRAVGYGSSLQPVDAVAPTASANRVTYSHSSLSEWYVNGPLGLEQGFTIPTAPAPHVSGPLTLSLAVSGDARVAPAAGGAGVLLSHGGSTLRYGELVATDARGRPLPSRVQSQRGLIALHVDTRGAIYPVRIDPLVQTGEKLPRGSEEEGGALLGFSVALSTDGNTALVGGPRDREYAGAVWTFTRSGGEWTQQGPKLTGTTTGSAGSERCTEQGVEEADECSFGRSVALSGDGNIALVGSPREPGPCAHGGECENRGAVWVFIRKEGTWSLQTKLTGGAEEGGEGRFGRAVALSADGGTALVGAPSDGGGPPGSAFVFTRSGSSWTMAEPKLTASGTQGEAHLGGSVALSGDGNTALVGAPADNGYIGAAFVFARSGPGSGWHQVGSKLTGEGESGAGHFGSSVALATQGTTALVGARFDNERDGAVWSFAPSGSGTWSEQGPKLTAPDPLLADDGAEFGYSIALTADGSRALIGAPRDGGAVGAAWLFARGPEGGWALDGSELTGAQGSKAWFGSSVALRADGTTALIGAPSEADPTTKEAKAGAVWVFADPAVLPLVGSLTPNAGPTAGGTTVTITGTRLAGASAVRFGSTPAASFTVSPDGSITAVSPANAEGGAVQVTVTTPESISPPLPAAVFTYVKPPSVGALSPSEGATSGGTPVTITGSHIGEMTQEVRFGNLRAPSFTVNSANSITASSPAEPAGTVHVTVSTPGGTSSQRAADRFTFVAPPGGSSGNDDPSAGGAPAGGVLGFSSGCTAALVSRSLPVLGHARAAVRLTWRGAGSCNGRLTLSLKVRSGRKTRTKTIGTATFALTSGRTRTIPIKLNAAGRALLRARHWRLNASLRTVSIAAGRTQARIATVHLSVPRPRRVTSPKRS